MTHFDTRYEDYVSMQDSKIKTPTSKHAFPGPTIPQRESIHTNQLKPFPLKISRKPQNLIKNKKKVPTLNPKTLSALPQTSTTSPKKQQCISSNQPSLSYSCSHPSLSPHLVRPPTLPTPSPTRTNKPSTVRPFPRTAPIPRDTEGVDIADGFKTLVKREGEGVDVADGFRRRDGEGVDVADGFRKVRREGEGVDVADGFRKVRREGEGVDVADGFKRRDGESIDVADGFKRRDGEGVDVADGF